MGFASKAGRARTNPRSPQAHAICDRCGGRYNHVDLTWQLDWAGSSMFNKRLLVCRPCLDRPQEQLRMIALPPDPVAIQNPRPEGFIIAESDYGSIVGGSVDFWTGIPVPGNTTVSTPSGQSRTSQATGAPEGSLINTPGVPYGYEEVPKSS